jgi:lipopolysaccharide/colanic/teichoic acid biosynthesis glycosyltransferase
VRTLPTDVPRYADKHQLADHHIPAFCRFLRRFHLDELPQLVLVLTGRMSLVGPRPEMAELHQRMQPEFAQERTAVRPGCTGLWQIGNACGELIGAAPEFDRFYLAHRTVRLDLWVLARTALQMSGLGGLVSLSDVPRWALPPRPASVRVIDLTSLERSATMADEPGAVAVTASR